MHANDGFEPLLLKLIKKTPTIFSFLVRYLLVLQDNMIESGFFFLDLRNIVCVAASRQWSDWPEPFHYQGSRYSQN